MEQKYDVLLYPRSNCCVCGSELDIKIEINHAMKQMKFYYSCNECKTCACDTMRLIERSKVEYVGEK